MTSTKFVHRNTLIQSLILALIMAFATAGNSWAQDATDDQQAADQDQSAQAGTDQDNADQNKTEEESVELNRIQVTGSLLKREDFTSASPMQIINADTQAQVGQLSVAQILQNSTVAAGTTQFNNQFSGFVIQGGTGVQTLDLRGLGDKRTLILLNGRRPGGSGTRGQTQAVDLTMLPEIAVQRAEIVLDGSSSIYGSDAVAGVANIITRRSVDGTEVQAVTEQPFDSGGQRSRIGVITGLNFAKGAVTFAAQYEKRSKLAAGDRNYLNCTQDIAYDENGNRIDREDRSITAGTPLSGCQDLYANTVIDFFITGGRLIPSPDGVTIGSIPGYRPRANGRYDDPAGEAYYEDVLAFPFTKNASMINENERTNVYATADYSFDFWGGVDWDMDVLYSRRETKTEGWRQFFPVLSSAYFVPYQNDPSWVPSVFLPAGQPVMPYPSNSDTKVDYWYVTSGLQGVLPTKNYWSWQVYASYSHSDGDYSRNSILLANSGDWGRGVETPPPIDFYDPAILSGDNMQALIDAIGAEHTGNTVYKQFQATAILSGDLFEMPAGTVATAFGVEYRRFSINDQPSQLSIDSALWGESSALVTKGTNHVMEAFAEAEIPLLSGLPAVENLSLNLSGRVFKYKDGGSDNVYKTGLRWNLTPTYMLRGTYGTSYRAPALYEQYLGNLTYFNSQSDVDACINWGESTNQHIRENCAADGIPSDYNGFPSSSAEITAGGGVDTLESETSDAYTLGMVWTPEFTNLSIAVDYYNIHVKNEIAQLGPDSIVAGCYNSENFPNAFCDLFTRKPADDPSTPYNIATVRDTYVNINSQRVEGVDLNVRWDQDFSFGNIVVEGQSTWTFKNAQQLFDPSQIQGFETTDYAGTVGSPKNVSNLRVTLDRNDWVFNYYAQYVARTSDYPFVDSHDSYFGYPTAEYDVSMDSVIYHSFSVIYKQDKWDLLVGINNAFDKKPDTVSNVYRGMRGGNVPVAATQYDLLGRRAYMRLNVRF
ncbi:MAG: TonB-dependent receptor [Lysobacterales bacterium]|jgi:iron complex outermembrane receptor protein